MDKLYETPEVAGGISDTTLEAAVLESLMDVSADDAIGIVDLLSADTFTHGMHARIFEAIDQVVRAGRRADYIEVRQTILEQNGDTTWDGRSLSDESTFDARQLRGWALRLVEMQIKRRIQSIALWSWNRSRDRDVDALDLQDELERRSFGVMDDIMQHMGSVSSPDDVWNEVIDMYEAAENEQGVIGTPMAFKNMNRLFHGWQNKYYVIAARPSMGKTTFMVRLVRDLVIEQNEPTLVFSLEAGRRELVDKMITGATKVSSDRINAGQLSDEEWRKIRSVEQQIREAPLYIDDNPKLTITQIVSRVRRLVRTKEIRHVFIDYLQIVNAEREYGDTRETEVSKISSELNALKKNPGVTVCALAQLNRASATRSDKRPRLSDLRESGAIEQDADVVMLPYRPEYYGFEHDDHLGNTEGKAEIYVPKNRDGKRNERLKYAFLAAQQTFERLSWMDQFESSSSNDSPF